MNSTRDVWFNLVDIAFKYIYKNIHRNDSRHYRAAQGTAFGMHYGFNIKRSKYIFTTRFKINWHVHYPNKSHQHWIVVWYYLYCYLSKLISLSLACSIKAGIYYLETWDHVKQLYRRTDKPIKKSKWNAVWSIED